MDSGSKKKSKKKLEDHRDYVKDITIQPERPFIGDHTSHCTSYKNS